MRHTSMLRAFLDTIGVTGLSPNDAHPRPAPWRMNVPNRAIVFGPRDESR